MADIEINNEEASCQDSAEFLLEKYDRRRAQKTDDIFAMQSVICILLAAVFAAANLVLPELCGKLWERLCALVSDEREIIPNLIDLFLKWVKSL